MNKKSELFNVFLNEEELNCFETKTLNDEEHTVLYRSYVQTDIGNMPLFIILDDSIYSVMRVVVGANVVNDTNRQAIHAFMNHANSRYKSFKYYIEEGENTVYLDCIYMSGESNFEPRLLYVLMSQIVKYLPDVVPELKTIFGIDMLPNPYAAYEHTHTDTHDHTRNNDHDNDNSDR